MKNLIKNHFEGNIMFHLESFIDVDYNISESGFIFYENNDPLIKKFLNQFEKLTAVCHSKLSQNNFDIFIQECISLVIPKIELIIFKKQFTQFGGLQFDKDVRTLMLFFSNKTQKTVRDKFLRLIQIASLLKMFKINEVSDQIGEGQVMSWRLTPNEIRNVLKLRKDFTIDSIQKLKL
jgi:conserved oligomeric Golgi complex subunit 4